MEPPDESPPGESSDARSRVLVRLVPGYGERRDRPGTTLLAVIQRAKAPLGRACGGRGVCRSCVVRVLAGSDRLMPTTPAEDRWALAPGQRLACQARLKRRDTASQPAPEAVDASQTLESPSPEAEVVLWSPGWGSPLPPTSTARDE